ncbi:hypothetical protein EGW08_005759, partial [Elysia chlorotica]
DHPRRFCRDATKRPKQNECGGLPDVTGCSQTALPEPRADSSDCGHVGVGQAHGGIQEGAPGRTASLKQRQRLRVWLVTLATESDKPLPQYQGSLISDADFP